MIKMWLKTVTCLVLFATVTDCILPFYFGHPYHFHPGFYHPSHISPSTSTESAPESVSPSNTTPPPRISVPPLNVTSVPVNLTGAPSNISCTSSNSTEPSSNSTRESTWPKDLKTPFKYPTYSPIDIITTEANRTTVPTNIAHYIESDEIAIFHHFDYSVTAIKGPEKSSTYINGGFLNNRYFFEGISFFWSLNLREPCSSTINGQGTPLQTRAYHRNEKYDTIDEAELHRDGFIIIQVDVHVESYWPNPLFEPFRYKLQQIRNVNSTVNVTHRELFQWLGPFPNITNYYTYPGSYIDFKNQRLQYNSSTIVVVPPEFQPCISISQFLEFWNLWNSTGDEYANTLNVADAGNRPIIIGDSSEVIFL